MDEAKYVTDYILNGGDKAYIFICILSARKGGAE
jgi:hypothetical protein